MPALQCANPVCEERMSAYDEGVDCIGCGQWFCDRCYDHTKMFSCEAHPSVDNDSKKENQTFRVFECPSLKQIMDAMAMSKPIHMIVGKTISDAGYITVRIQKIVAPSIKNPGNFVFYGFLKEIARGASFVQWNMDYETQCPVGEMRWWSEEPRPTHKRVTPATSA